MPQPVQSQFYLVIAPGSDPNTIHQATLFMPRPFQTGDGVGVGLVAIPLGEEQLTELMTRLAEAQSQQEAQKAHPASKKIISGLPHRHVTLENVPDQQCIVCLEDWEADQEALEMPCGHIYHNDCLLPWLERANTCPCCRYPLYTEDEEFNKKVKAYISSRNSSHKSHSVCCVMKSIGLCEAEEPDSAVSLSCGHSFHECCFKTSLRSTGQGLGQIEIRCPYCRANSRINNSL
ncbi:hypothetical protein DSO57_1033816 [Entomophthora muscae]|uniref:Uncharacterized protein n=1 Tax=Entomophthora muscae TaxID=34485 RepID=A0ACC2TB26_9FUNG|nr:hypothetical protein DSO57_1033816 [Entomophthora muscae]